MIKSKLQITQEILCEITFERFWKTMHGVKLKHIPYTMYFIFKYLNFLSVFEDFTF